MGERSIAIYDAWSEATGKFDYFICGVAGALFAYIGQAYEPRIIALDATLLEPVALMFFALSFFVGLKRIEACNTARRFNHQALEAAEAAGNLAKALASGNVGPYFNPEGGEVMDIAKVQAKYNKHMHRQELLREPFDRVSRKAQVLYNIRNYFLLGGFVATFLDKLFKPYI